jgi:nucleotide-binding universal stress UspA family protein
VVHGPAGPVLVEAAKDADLLVVGIRSLGAVRRFLLGPVSNYCVHYGHCPAVVIPEPSSQAEDGDAEPAAAPLT